MSVTVKASLIICLMLRLLCAQAQDAYQFSGMLDYGYYLGYDGKSQFGSISRNNVAFDANKQINRDLSLTLKLSTRFFLKDPSSGEYLVNEDNKYPGSAEATAGIKGPFGQLRFGRAMSAMWANDWVFDAWDNYNAIASPGWFMWHGNSPVDPNASIINASFARLNDGLYYASPEFGGGFSFDASYGTRVREGDQNHSASMALKYTQKEFALLYAHEKTPVNNAVQFVAGKVNWGALTLMGAFDDEQMAGGSRNRSMTASGRQTLGEITFLLGFGRQIDYHANFIGAGIAYTIRPNVSVYLSYGKQGKGFWGRPSSSDALGAGASYSF